MTRDSLLLPLGVFIGLAAYLAGNKVPWEWDYYAWIAFAGYVLSVVSAQLGTSRLPGKVDPNQTTKDRVDPRRFIGLGLIVLLTSGGLACASWGGPRHVLTIADKGIYESIHAISTAEIIATTAGALSPEQSRAINQKLLPAALSGAQLNDRLLAWDGKWPIPPDIPPLIIRLAGELQALLQEIKAEIPDGVAKATLLSPITDAQQKLLGLAVVTGGR
jgi:hypothetical protein